VRSLLLDKKETGHLLSLPYYDLSTLDEGAFKIAGNPLKNVTFYLKAYYREYQDAQYQFQHKALKHYLKQQNVLNDEQIQAFLKRLDHLRDALLEGDSDVLLDFTEEFENKLFSGCPSIQNQSYDTQKMFIKDLCDAPRRDYMGWERNRKYQNTHLYFPKRSLPLDVNKTAITPKNASITWKHTFKRVEDYSVRLFRSGEYIYAGGHGYLYRLNPHSGEEYARSDLKGCGYGWIDLCPLPNQQAVIVTLGSHILCLNESSLEERWRITLPKVEDSTLSLACDERHLYASGWGKLYKINLENGHMLKSLDGNGHLNRAQPLMLLPNQNRLFTLIGRRFIEIESDTFRIVKEQNLEASSGYFSADAFIKAPSHYLISGDNALWSVDKEGISISKANREVISECGTALALEEGGVQLLMVSGRTLYCYHEATLSLQWSTTIPLIRDDSPVVMVHDGDYIVLVADNLLFLLDRYGQILHMTRIAPASSPKPYPQSLLIHDNQILIGSEGMVCAIPYNSLLQHHALSYLDLNEEGLKELMCTPKNSELFSVTSTHDVTVDLGVERLEMSLHHPELMQIDAEGMALFRLEIKGVLESPKKPRTLSGKLILSFPFERIMLEGCINPESEFTEDDQLFREIDVSGVICENAPQNLKALLLQSINQRFKVYGMMLPLQVPFPISPLSAYRWENLGDEHVAMRLILSHERPNKRAMDALNSFCMPTSIPMVLHLHPEIIALRIRKTLFNDFGWQSERVNIAPNSLCLTHHHFIFNHHDGVLNHFHYEWRGENCLYFEWDVTFKTDTFQMGCEVCYKNKKGYIEQEITVRTLLTERFWCTPTSAFMIRLLEFTQSIATTLRELEGCMGNEIRFEERVSLSFKPINIEG